MAKQRKAVESCCEGLEGFEGFEGCLFRSPIEIACGASDVACGASDVR